VKRALAILAALLALALASAGAGAFFLERYLDTPLSVPEAGAVFEIPAGASFAGIAARLEEQGLLQHASVLRVYARVHGRAGKVHAGEYFIAPGTTARSLLDQFTSGAVILHAFTIVEGWNHRELLAALKAVPAIESSLGESDWPALLTELGAGTDSPEGLFLPETYRFPRGTTDRALLAEAYRLMQSALKEEWAARSGDTPLETPYEALILASIIEKETARDDERDRIAGVFVRRLKKNMRLQTDPTVIYGLGASFDGNLTRRHLQSDTPYNTYTRAGLPPTPIAMPGRAAIHAALHPAAGDAMYFVATGEGDGSHRFSVTAEEHARAVQAYLRRLRESR
jgi:UPF0755 protein